METPLTTTISGTMAATGLGMTTVYKLIGQGKLETVKVGRRTLVSWDSIRTLLDPSADRTRVSMAGSTKCADGSRDEYVEPQRAWCDQCEMRVTQIEASGCKSRHCRAKIAA